MEDIKPSKKQIQFFYSSWQPYACRKHRETMQKPRTICGLFENQWVLEKAFIS